ncbi:hypothetical protein [Fulvivirga ligni]|uniref:hypothetical protein n=1 Tax=Fulvivirga ligni TaxID=2904246 RepID=UPI001F3F9C0E|nr:hypothetical protein [Fulvivirga ligni]UII23216.1 hypothetical protein LVD16_08245 [Fulvivirga ligni]
MRLFLTLVIIFLSLTVKAQLRPKKGHIKNFEIEQELWYEGQVTLENGKVLTGELNYNFINDLLRLRNDDKIRSFTSEQALSFQYTNEGALSVYYSLPFKNEMTNRAKFVFYKVLYQAKDVALLCRHDMIVKQDQDVGYDNQTIYQYEYEDVERTIYLVKLNQEPEPMMKAKIIETSKFSQFFLLHYRRKKPEGTATDEEDLKYSRLYKGEVYDLFPEQRDQLKEYIEKENLKLKTEEGWIQLLKYRDTLA